MTDEQTAAEQAEDDQAENDQQVAEQPAAELPVPELPTEELPAEEPDATDDAADAEAGDDAEEGEAPEDGEAAEGGEEAGYDGKIEVGADVFVNVTRITPYGAFVTLTDGRTGLIHISEIDRNYVKEIREHVREGDRVEARITAIKEDGKIDLSIKAMQDPQPRMQKGRDPEFESMLKKFLRSSDERQVDFKRSQMHKRR